MIFICTRFVRVFFFDPPKGRIKSGRILSSHLARGVPEWRGVAPKKGENFNLWNNSTPMGWGTRRVAGVFWLVRKCERLES